ncbi:recombinase family protein [Brevibacillus gelatini]|uniref:Recombinase family protein n=1 Tax=Brevibacillus gelatini TaxID=1655277 RepID=A0A3M8BGC3_9BACL|nr:recombinase family protein [Brevibacillus gelatini]RNB62017.1 recombinase family protein [Brevibacillus gelatini]
MMTLDFKGDPVAINVAIYARVSTEEQAEQGYSIPAQLEVLRSLCKSERKIVYKEYVDAGISGKSIDKRPALQELLRDVEEGKIQEVLVWKLDRISRKTSDLLYIVEKLNKNNVKFRSYSEKEFDTETAAGKLSIQILGVIAEFQRNTIIENVKMGMKQRARNGKWNGGNVLGYNVVEVPSGKGSESVLLVNPVEAELVRKIFRMYAAGQGLRSIANQLNNEGYRTKLGNSFSTVAVKTILTNPVYIGKIRYNVRENWNEKRRKGINPNPIIADGEHEPIIDMDTWEAVQKLYGKKSKTSPRVFEGTYLLTGLMRCPQCGGTLGAHRVKDKLKDGTVVVRRYYVCNRFRNNGSRVCSSNSVRADLVEDFVMNRIKEVVLQPKILEDIVNKINKDRSKSVLPLQKEIAALDKELKTLESQKQKYFKLYESDAIDNDFLVERLNELKAKFDQFAQRKREAERQLETNTSSPISIKEVREVLTMFHKLLENSPLNTQKTLLQTVIKQVHVKKNGKELEGIELEFDEGIKKCFLTLAPSTDKVEGAFAFRKQKSPSRYTLVI